MIHRRDAMLRLGQFGLGSLSLPSLLRAEQTRGAVAIGSQPSAKSCILIYLWGGPPQQDMWDLKPLAAEGIRSHFQPIQTVVPGIDVCEHLPLFARHTDKTAIIRSLTHDSNNHEPSVYRTLTGRINNTLVVPRNQRNRHDFPNLGSVVSYFTPLGSMPASVTIPRPIGHDGSTYSGTYAGFLGGRYDPMEVAAAEETNEKPTHSIALPPEIQEPRLLARRGLLNVIEETDRRYQSVKSARGMDSYREQAFGMLASPIAKRAFNLDLEDPRTRDRYGRNEYGESILLARRLVESGVRLVTISWMYIQKNGNVANVWDNHGPFEGLNGTEMLKARYCLPSLDQGFSALMDDLQSRGLLDETLVAMWGEFGRTPKLNPSQGRDHWGACQSAVLAGGGIQGGQLYGSSDKDAAYPSTNPVSPEDMLATVYHALGLSPETELRDPLNRPHRLVDGRPLLELFG
ncbi:MAG: hypothetical protein JWP89_4769 [Schlesneria sp.]|nr:hypothetical protein [Schlesneria sp.]